ncbi:hypothetical protein AC579_4420 [Pseudocercospora musae]|uniref:Uncharacterized protein n=1 Tax=Pseudocercospora musae TaxID=113226 RepID=A0A139I1B5_9PEZI|nr:hypothetical protein AC579_4420 [Pseudocercospora musae]
MPDRHIFDCHHTDAVSRPAKRPKTERICSSPKCAANTRQAACQKAASPPTPQVDRNTNTTIMDLPKELLVEIVGHALTVGAPITLRERKEARWSNEIATLRDIPQWSRQQRFPAGYQHPPKRKRMRKSPLLPVIAVCKDFYFAGLEAYYSKNVFHFESVSHLQQVKARLSEKHKSFLEKIEIEMQWFRVTSWGVDPPVYCPSPSTLLSEDLLADLPKLKGVVVVCLSEMTVYLAAASNANTVKEQIQDLVMKRWKTTSEKGILRFVFPKEWGVVENK